MQNQKLIILTFSLILLALGLQAREYDIKDYLNPDNTDRKAYIEKYKSIAIEEMKRSGIPASIKLAQGILESGDGKSKLAREANNHFGMKCGTKWDGDTFYLKDDDYDANGNLVKSCFRVFETPEESYYAHSEFLHDPRKSGRYGYLFNLDIRDYRAWAKGLKRAGYATNPKYPDLLIGIIEANKLYAYDQEGLFELELAEAGTPTPTPTDVSGPQIPDNVAANEVVLNNGIRMIFAQEGDSPRSIEDFFGVTAKKVAIYNELYEGGSFNFSEGDRIYLQSKRKKWRGTENYHKVEVGQTMYDIAQMYGLKIKHLYKKNRMTKGTEPAVGQSLSLKRKISPNRMIKLRDSSKDPIEPEEKPDEEPTYDLSDGNNVVDIIRVNIEAFDMVDRADAYLRITDGVPSTPAPNPPNPPSPPNPQPTQPDIVTPPYPNPTPPEVVTPPNTPSPPSPQPNAMYHTVTSGDTLYSISRQYGITVGDIKRLNGLSNNIISIGQQLRVR